MPSGKRSNNKYLVAQWAVALGTCVLAVMRLVHAHMPPLAIASVMLFVVLAGLLLVVGVRGAGSRTLRRLLQQQDPSALLAWCTRVGRRGPKYTQVGMQAAAASWATLYEQPWLAEARLAGVDWQPHPPFIQANALIARALLRHAAGDVHEGLRLARTARAMGEMDSRLPGAKTSALAFGLHVALGEVFAGVASRRTVETLREARARLPLLGQLLAAWGLCVLGRDADAEPDVVPAPVEVTDAARFIAENAPHCGLLRRVPGAPPRSTDELLPRGVRAV